MNASDASLSPLRDFIAANRRLVVITGAGVSVSSGIPTYRDRDGVWRHSAPVTHQEFVSDAARRRRYWARSLLGWPAVRDARPNQAHLALARLEHLGHVDLLITQNVDRLHQRAGSVAVIDLHGRVDQVRCLHWTGVVARELVQQQLLRDNPQRPDLPAQRRPDGDADVADDWVESIVVPDALVYGKASGLT